MWHKDIIKIVCCKHDIASLTNVEQIIKRAQNIKFCFL